MDIQSDYQSTLQIGINMGYSDTLSLQQIISLTLSEILYYTSMLKPKTVTLALYIVLINSHFHIMSNTSIILVLSLIL